MNKKRGRPVIEITLNAAEIEYLQSLLRKRNLPAGEARRARALLHLDKGKSNLEVAHLVGACSQTVSSWRKRFAREGIEGVSEAPRSGAPRTIEDEQIQEVITLTLESKPKDATHWSTRSMAKEVGISHNAISRIWKAFGLQPHRKE